MSKAPVISDMPTTDKSIRDAAILKTAAALYLAIPADATDKELDQILPPGTNIFKTIGKELDKLAAGDGEATDDAGTII